MYTERVLRTARLQFAQKHHAVVHLAHRDVPVLDAREEALHFVELVIVRGEKRASVRPRVLVDIFHDGPGYGDAVVGRRAAPEFVEKHEAALAQVVHDICRLVHLHHKGALAERDIVARPHAGEYFVHHADSCAVGRHERAHLRQERDECRLAEQGTFTCHVRAGHDDDLLRRGVEHHVVCHIFLADWHQRFNHGVPSLPNVDGEAFVHRRAHVTPFAGHGRERLQAVERGKRSGIFLQGSDVAAYVIQQLCIEFRFERKNFVLCP